MRGQDSKVIHTNAHTATIKNSSSKGWTGGESVVLNYLTVRPQDCNEQWDGFNRKEQGEPTPPPPPSAAEQATRATGLPSNGEGEWWCAV